MTSATDKMAYIVGRQKPQTDNRDGCNAKRIAEAVARIIKYLKA